MIACNDRMRGRTARIAKIAPARMRMPFGAKGELFHDDTTITERAGNDRRLSERPSGMRVYPDCDDRGGGRMVKSGIGLEPSFSLSFFG
jgi:hypothetical protein